MSALYCIADFYICTSAAEGQNLPLLEAMAHGSVPVSTGNTAMADYITADNAFQIAERSVPNISEHMAGTIAGKPFNIHSTNSRDVSAALAQSRAATPARPGAGRPAVPDCRQACGRAWMATPSCVSISAAAKLPLLLGHTLLLGCAWNRAVGALVLSSMAHASLSGKCSIWKFPASRLSLLASLILIQSPHCTDLSRFSKHGHMSCCGDA